MTDNALLIVLISHPNFDPDVVSEQLGMTPSLKQKSGCQVVTPRGTKTGSRYVVSKWQYKKRIGVSDDFQKELVSVVEQLSQHRDFLRGVVAEGGKNTIYFSATDFPHAALVIEPMLMKEMLELKLAFGFEFVSTNPDD